MTGVPRDLSDEDCVMATLAFFYFGSTSDSFSSRSMAGADLESTFECAIQCARSDGHWWLLVNGSMVTPGSRGRSAGW
jgi:hypothetical protein